MNTDLYIFTCFLGSGKTTVLRDLLSQMHSRKVGVIVNEWGNLGIDKNLIRSAGVETIVETSSPANPSTRRGKPIHPDQIFKNEEVTNMLPPALGSTME